MTINDIRTRINSDKTRNRSAWGRGITAYANDLLDTLEEAQEHGDFDIRTTEAQYLRKAMLNGASDWAQYSWGGCSLCYDGDIAERVCTPSELKRNRGGELRPNSREEWLDTQARALRQAANRVYCAIKALAREEARA